MTKVRCAIYTRKSSEEGLEQDFNSLHAQREACAAYILSQASEGWSLLPEDYDDGGLSGGTLERPALRRLLADIYAGKIDIVVVYKVDRLTRSLLDFSKLVEAFDKAGTSFVSVTQSFNTTTSMGRLTLNMLLSFAQFEREVTAERIRDKIAASKAKGMWMGGVCPLGYRPDGRTLAIVPEHAEVIRELFRRYLQIGNVRLLAEALDSEIYRVPSRTTSTGRAMGGGKFARGQIYKILSNPTYLGEVHHKGQVYPGKHPAIIERETWENVQARLGANTRGEQRTSSIRSPSMLAGLIVDDQGKPLVASHACKGKVRYRYYVSRHLQHEPNGDQSGIRMSAPELEKAVTAEMATLFDRPLALIERARLQPAPNEMVRFVGASVETAENLRKRVPQVVRELITQIRIAPQSINVDVSTTGLAKRLGVSLQSGAPDIIHLRIDAQLKRTGKVVRLVQRNGRSASGPAPQEHLIKLLRQARSWWQEMCDDGLSASELADRRGVNKSYVSRVIRINFLAPQIVESILAGDHPAGLDARAMLGMHALPLNWATQMQSLNVN
ncbi:recombinase family protein [Tsuneonella sp. HG222]